MCSINEEGNLFLQKQFKNEKVLLTNFYRASRDGWMYKDFHSLSDHSGATITLL